MLSSVWPTLMSLQNANFQTCARTCDSQRVFQLCFSFTFVSEHMLHMVFLLQIFSFDFFLIKSFQGSGWRVVASFEGALPKRMKGLPLDSMFELSSVKKVSINLSSVLWFNLSCFTAHP